MITAATHATLNAYASQLAGRPGITVECLRNQRFQGAVQGYTNYHLEADGSISFDPFIMIPERACAALSRLIVSRSPRTHPPTNGVDLVRVGGPILDRADGNALETFTHEAMHLRLNSANEAQVECATYRNLWPALRLFRLAAWKAREVLRGMVAAHFASDPAYLAVC